MYGQLSFQQSEEDYELVLHRGCGGMLIPESQPYWAMVRGADTTVQEPVLHGTETMFRCTQCGHVGVAV